MNEYQKYRVTISKGDVSDTVCLYGKDEDHVMSIVAESFVGYVIDKIEPLGNFIDEHVYHHTGK